MFETVTNKEDFKAKYPESAKLAAVRDQSQAIGEFLEWMGSGAGLVLAEWLSVLEPDNRYVVEESSRVSGLWRVRDLVFSRRLPRLYSSEREARDRVAELETARCAEADEDKRLFRASRSVNQLLAKFFDIDLDKVESERRQMLESLGG